ncbi:uncharacterized protein A1O5_12596 [Cladophialophora psammophila CBS 110553]|uniref:Rhodopsin domain-containing protein n=1 Tax=Cladophialophora psammophila CBS 110553 TaxID=1182543 RepID=W9WCU6_9EURO|nr:uncharacterized protein A1O5_12596 [Cladophialophora psammophila CBS 110553]EXJ56329.1 hypothetical protein A1O5_12596 [Cladophialophora psammophila CBS 110553]
MFYAGEMTYDITNAVTKISILAFYLRIFTDPKFKISAYILMGFVMAFLVAILPATIFQCTPISYMWTGWTGETEGHCIDVSSLTWVASSVNIIQDIAVILLPIPHLLKLSLSRKKKIQIVSMFCVGLFVTIASIVRLSSLIRFKATLNFSWDYVAVCYMSVVEIDVGVICACMPAMQLLLRRVAPRLFGSTADKSSYLHPHTGGPRSQSRTFRNTGARHSMAPNTITKTLTATVTEVAKDSDSVMELVDNPHKKGASHEGGSFATMSSADEGNKPNGW